MRWQDQSKSYRRFLALAYSLSIPAAVYCLGRGEYTPEWVFLTVISLVVATINVRLPKISTVISMGDVFIVLAVLYFGAGPALVTHWLGIGAAHFSDVVRKHGPNIRGKIILHRFLFNLSCCALSICAMDFALMGVGLLRLERPASLIAELTAIALSWFLVNTITISLAISFWMNKRFFSVWTEGLHLYLLNFLGSASAAGLVVSFYQKVETTVLLFSVPIAFLLYQLHRFYISKFEQAQTHIGELSKLYLQTVEALATAVDAKDRYTHGHIRRVQAYACEIAKLMGITDENEMMGIRAGALLHDIGKIAIPEFILNKPAALTENEYEKMKLHPSLGANMLRNIEFPYPVVPLVRSHHERWDGRGYPDGLRGDHIPLAARILSLVDCYDALTTNRPYRAPMERAELIEFFQKESGKAYDPEIVRIFVENLPAIENAGKELTETEDLWEVPEAVAQVPLRRLEAIQPLTSYGKALGEDPRSQENLRAVLTLARNEAQFLAQKDILLVMGSRLADLVRFDAAVFYVAHLDSGTIVSEHAIGPDAAYAQNITLNLDHKMSGWAAANNQTLNNMPAVHDFKNYPEAAQTFKISAIAAMNRQGSVVGAITLYRREFTKFGEDEFRRLELVAAQTALALTKCRKPVLHERVLFDAATGLPNADHIHLIFEQVVTDARKFDYELALMAIQLGDGADSGSWANTPGGDRVQPVAGYLAQQLRPTDLLVRYAEDELIAVLPRIEPEEADKLKTRFLEDLARLHDEIRPDLKGQLAVRVGVAMFPIHGTDLETLLGIAKWNMHQDTDVTSKI